MALDEQPERRIGDQPVDSLLDSGAAHLQDAGEIGRGERLVRSEEQRDDVAGQIRVNSAFRRVTSTRLGGDVIAHGATARRRERCQTLTPARSASAAPRLTADTISPMLNDLGS